jgi:hypothetical protein
MIYLIYLIVAAVTLDLPCVVQSVQNDRDGHVQSFSTVKLSPAYYRCLRRLLEGLQEPFHLPCDSVSPCMRSIQLIPGSIRENETRPIRRKLVRLL